MARGIAIRHQPRRQLSIHTDPIRYEEHAAGCGGHSDRMGDNNLECGCCLAALEMGRRGSGAVFRLGVAGDSFAIVDYLDELGDAIIDAVRQANGGAVSYSAQTGNESIEIAWQIM